MSRRSRTLGLLLVGAALAFPPLAGSESKGTATAATKPAPGDPAAGKKLYKTHCSLCHFADATIVKVGPGMKDLFKQEKLAVSKLPLTEENVRKRIAEGSPDPQKPLMPAYKNILTAPEMNDLMAYLKTL